MDVMRYLISNVWYWRARLTVQSIAMADDAITVDVVNDGQASTANASLEYRTPMGEVVWASPMFGVNATNSSTVSFSVGKDTFEDDGYWNLNYQKRVINAAIWVNETVDNATSVTMVESEEGGFLIGFGLFNPLAVILGMIGASVYARREDTE